MSAGAAISVAIIGNPNTGKTCLFNALTGAHQHVGNWPGVTVERKTGTYVYQGQTFHVTDLPGLYNLLPCSTDEEVAEAFLHYEPPDVLVNIVDATNLERHLVLTGQLLELRLPLVLALNMMDEADEQGIKIDSATLSAMLGVPVVPMVARRNKGVPALVATIAALARSRAVAPAAVKYAPAVDEALAALQARLDAAACPLAARERALMLLRGRPVCAADAALLHEAMSLRERVEQRVEDTLEHYLLACLFGFAHGVARACVVHSHGRRFDLTERLDNYLTHPLLGLLVFAAAMWGTFELVFRASAPFTSGLEWLFGTARALVLAQVPPGLARDLLADGIIMGVGGVLSFLPSVLLLFLAIGVLEDSGYMARAAFIMDGIMHRLGLHGKSFIPMLVGFGCTVPAVLATRTLDTRRERLITALIVPFMSCGARLPVYTLFISAFFAPAWQGTVLTSLYALGILVAIVAANVLGRLLFGADRTPLLMELPPYRLPTLRSVAMLMWQRTWMYVKRAGTLLLGASVVMWLLCNFPRPAAPYEAADPAAASAIFAHSYAARLGRAIEPVFRPLGFDWKITVGLMSGLAAKEAVIATLMVVYGVGDADEHAEALQQHLRDDPLFHGTPWRAYTLLVFVLLYVPCIAVMAVFRQEFGWKWTVFMTAYTTATAWVVAWIVHMLGRVAGLLA